MTSSNKTVPIKKLFLTGFILTFLIVAIAVVGAGYEYSHNNEVGLAKVNRQLSQLPELEEDIFAKCMEQKKSDAKNIAFCQENTQKQMHTLAQDLQNAKNDIMSRNWYDFIKIL